MAFFTGILTIAPTVASVDALPDEDAELEFVTRFRELLRIKNILTSFADFKETDLSLPEQDFEDYKSKYLDVHDKHKGRGEAEVSSILDDVDFELDLIHRDEINVAYILNLLVSLNKLDPVEAKRRQKEIIDLVAGEIQLRSKRELIEQFIDNNLPKMKPNENVIGEFENYWLKHKLDAYEKLCAEENLDPAKFAKVLEVYQFANRLPINHEVKATLAYKPFIKDSKAIVERVKEKIQNFITTFIDGMGGSV